MVGRSVVLGKPLALLLVQANATVTVCHTRTRERAAICRRADLLCAATGRPGLISRGHGQAGGHRAGLRDDAGAGRQAGGRRRLRRRERGGVLDHARPRGHGGHDHRRPAAQHAGGRARPDRRRADPAARSAPAVSRSRSPSWPAWRRRRRPPSTSSASPGRSSPSATPPGCPGRPTASGTWWSGTAGRRGGSGAGARSPSARTWITPALEVVQTAPLTGRLLGGVPRHYFDRPVPVRLIHAGRGPGGDGGADHGPRRAGRGDRCSTLEAAGPVPAGSFGVFDVGPFREVDGLLHQPAADDLAGCAAILSALMRCRAQGVSGGRGGGLHPLRGGGTDRGHAGGPAGAAASADGGRLPGDEPGPPRGGDRRRAGDPGGGRHDGLPSAGGGPAAPGPGAAAGTRSGRPASSAS